MSISNEGIQQFYYTSNLPDRSIAIAKIDYSEYTPDDILSINNVNNYQKGTLQIWKRTSDFTGPADYTANSLKEVINISGIDNYIVNNGIFEITNILDSNQNALFYFHPLPSNVSDIKIIDINGNILEGFNFLIDPSNNYFYHSLDGTFYRIQYVDNNGFVRNPILQYNLVISRSKFQPSNNTYIYSAKSLVVANNNNYYIRFIDYSGYQILNTYHSISNIPWYLRIRFSTNSIPPEYLNQNFLPFSPFLLASWVKGTYLDYNTIQFERTGIYQGNNRYPDILIFDKNNKLKYAIDGTPIGQTSEKGTDYPWQRGLFQSIDYNKARIELSINIDPTDIIYGFYLYDEYDILLTNLDINPFTNQNIRNSIISIYVYPTNTNTNTSIYYRIINYNGNLVSTNDPSYNSSTAVIIGTIVNGVSVSDSKFTITDIRTRGGGLKSLYTDLPIAQNFWDLGNWNGKSYPASGATIIYLPSSVLVNTSKSEIQNLLDNLFPPGMIYQIYFYDEFGNEIV